MIGIACALVAIGLAFLVLRSNREPRANHHTPPTDQTQGSAAQNDSLSPSASSDGTPPWRRHHHHDDDVTSTPSRINATLRRVARRGQQPELDAKDYIAVLRENGETGGLAAFPPPGTNPPKSGIIVPEGYQLPEGYVRHYQTTDDGRRLDAILMLSPDYEFIDEHGSPIDVAEDRIVPPELAPPGLPIQLLEVPTTSANQRDDGR